MLKTAIALVVLISMVLAAPAYAKTYKSTYPLSCTELWAGVKDTLSDPQHYSVQNNDDAQMHAEYNVKHEAHVTISGAILQRTNKVTLVPKGAGCEMQVVSNWSGVEHNDREDFKKRVDESLIKLKSGAPAEPAKPVEPPK